MPDQSRMRSSVGPTWYSGTHSTEFTSPPSLSRNVASTVSSLLRETVPLSLRMVRPVASPCVRSGVGEVVGHRLGGPQTLQVGFERPPRRQVVPPLGVVRVEGFREVVRRVGVVPP